MIEVRILHEAVAAMDALPASERVALDIAIIKRQEFGETLGFPHSSIAQAQTRLADLEIE